MKFMKSKMNYNYKGEEGDEDAGCQPAHGKGNPKEWVCNAGLNFVI